MGSLGAVGGVGVASHSVARAPGPLGHPRTPREPASLPARDGRAAEPGQARSREAAPKKSAPPEDSIDEQVLVGDPELYADYMAVRTLIMGEEFEPIRVAASDESEASAAQDLPAGTPAASAAVEPDVSVAPPPAPPAPGQSAASPAPQTPGDLGAGLVPQAAAGGASAGAVVVATEEVRIEIESLRFTRVVVAGGAPPATRSADPVVVDLDGDGIELTTVEAGARYDLTGDGLAEQAATVAPDDGFLVLDRDGDGQITPGTEFFGDQLGAVNGFAELARFDSNADARIDAQDSVFEQLAVYRDADRDGAAATVEVARLTDLGITALLLDYREADLEVAGNRVAQLSAYERADGTRGLLGDALLNYLA